MLKIEKTEFGSYSGQKASLFTVESGGLRASFTDLGAALCGLSVPAREPGHNCVLSYPDASFYGAGSSSLGATVGRYAGRIGGAAFTLFGHRYTLPANDGKNHLHGLFSKRLWGAQMLPCGVRFTLLSPAGEEGFPGALRVTADYEVTGSALRLTYRASSDAPTHLNLTNHAYFNLNGGGSVHSHTLRVFADAYAEVGPGLIPTGMLVPVRGGAFDLGSPRPLSDLISDPALASTRGLDHSFVLRGVPGVLRPAALLSSPETGLGLEVSTTQPTVHVYTAGFLGLDSAPVTSAFRGFIPHGGVCLETQHLPDSPNKPLFPSTLLMPGEEYCEVTEYRPILNTP